METSWEMAMFLNALRPVVGSKSTRLSPNKLRRRLGWRKGSSAAAMVAFPFSSAHECGKGDCLGR